jgi:hypothetical protein
MDRNEAISEIKAALRRRSGKTWSVTGGKGTAWGWIKISAPPKRLTQPYSYMTPEDCAELAKLLGLDKPVHDQGESIPASSQYYREYVDRAQGKTPSIVGTPYWD